MHFRLPQLLLGLAAVAIIAMAIVYTTQQMIDLKLQLQYWGWKTVSIPARGMIFKIPGDWNVDLAKDYPPSYAVANASATSTKGAVAFNFVSSSFSVDQWSAFPYSKQRGDRIIDGYRATELQVIEKGSGLVRQADIAFVQLPPRWLNTGDIVFSLGDGNARTFYLFEKVVRSIRFHSGLARFWHLLIFVH